jgi:tRNA A-37 threonylcarbamoyl transferase component Bud32
MVMSVPPLDAGLIDDPWLLTDIATSAVGRHDPQSWSVERGEFWCRVTAIGRPLPDQGWKLHVSATELSAPVVLARCAEVLLRERCSFKFAGTLAQLGELLSNHVGRGGGGKFVTAYPADDDQFRRLAAELDRWTDGLPGPVILSDRRLRPDSLVHYRFGVFGAETVLTNDGSYESMLTGPAGHRTKDERKAWYSPPPWSKSPLAEAEPPRPVPGPPPASPAAVLLGDRFIVREALRHSYRGGVFRAADRETGAEVVVKHARPYVMSHLSGTDGRDALRHEASMLDLLAETGLVPRVVALFTQQDNVFLAEELVGGATLRDWVAERATTTWKGHGAPVAEALALARQLVSALATVHEKGLVLRDLTPQNLMVTTGGEVRLIDLELAVPERSRVVRLHTMGYAAPEQANASWFGPAPARTADLYSLGATVLYLLTGLDPMLTDDVPAVRSAPERLSGLVTRLMADFASVRWFAPLLLGLLRENPDERWTLDRSADFLAADEDALVAGTGAGLVPAGSAPGGLDDSTADSLITDGLSHLLATLSLDGERLWPAGPFGDTTDPCNVQHGAAGVLGVLTRAAQVLGGGKYRDAVASVAGWVDRRPDIDPLLPGLYFGRSGTAWAMYDAARFLGDEGLGERAIELARRVPVRWPNPDVCHGAAGAGLAQLHLWAATGDPVFKRRALEAGAELLRAEQRQDGHAVWPIPATFDSELAGLTHYGFAHGVAGAGAFLLYCALASGRDEFLVAARRGGGATAGVGLAPGGGGAGPSGTGTGSSDAMRHWCSGASGVGTFLIRLWSVTAEPRYRDLAEAGARAVHRDRWYSTSAACHGLAGDGDFLLDLADLTGEARYRGWAADLGAVLHAHHAHVEGRLVIPDDSGTAVTAGYGTGLAGVIGFLLRLRHGGPRWWMPDRLLRCPDIPDAAPAVAGSHR